MPTPSLATLEPLRAVPARGPASASELAAALEVSVPALYRLLSRLADATVSAGTARRARYALVRPLRGGRSTLPVYAVDTAGQAHPTSQLVPLRPKGSWMDQAGTAEDQVRVQHLWWFGRLIGNTDRHTGNLSFRPEQERFTLAPLHDMLPMRYAPLAGGEAPKRDLSPVLPLPGQRPVWLGACKAARPTLMARFIATPWCPSKGARVLLRDLLT